jgi:lysophospholipase L1-like esterase
VALDFPKATIVDWYSASEGNNSYFYNDGVHLRREGAEVYASLVAKVVQEEKL